MNTPISEAARRAAEAAATFYSPNAWARKLDAADLAPIIQQAIDSAQPVEGETPETDAAEFHSLDGNGPDDRPDDVGCELPPSSHPGFVSDDDGRLIPESVFKSKDNPEPNPTLAQLAEGAAEQIRKTWAHRIGHLAGTELSAIILREISPEWERMVRENKALLAQNQKGSAEYLELRGNYRRTCDAMDALRSENERLTRDNKELLSSLQIITDFAANPDVKQFAALRARVRELEEDGKRLDWLEKTSRYADLERRGLDWTDSDIRAAIDIARKETP